jgi:hypothetical protein
VYADNLAEIFGETYNGVDLVSGLRGSGEICLKQLIINLKEYPITEYLFKLGLTNLASFSGVREMRGNSFSEVLKVNNNLKPLYRNMNPTWMEHMVIQSTVSWVSEEDFVKYRQFRFDYNRGDLDDIRDCLAVMSFSRFIKYFNQQKAVTGQKVKRLLIWYKDYIAMSRAMKVDLSRKSVKYPQNIRIAHDILVERYDEVKHEIEDENLRVAAEILYAGISEYANEMYCIVLPMSRTDFIREGQSLNHCVGKVDSYYTKHMEGTRMIFFVRQIENPEKPYYTLEVDMTLRKIQQLYGFGDSSAKTEVRKFANEFVRRMKPAERSA